ncbi:GNAT family N-acetyltransferase [Bacillus sp. FJAT-47783]|uniref:GNAT family N-acetyltransferase n=1 Tax=Bacillus sp. FJAT-47783 TaxID=2922712 RepID=UPI001FAD63F0|nr:GNAT family N-acetyltransferase [Bacillus sp. FJAT-47783]
MIRKIDITKKKMAEHVLCLQKKAYEVEAEYLGSEKLPPLRETLSSLLLSDEHFYGYFLNNDLVGAIAYEKQPHMITITRVMISPLYFRKGIASHLIQYLLKLEGDQNVYYVTTGTKNVPAIKLYQKFRFQETVQYMTREGIALTKLKRLKML